MCVYNIHDAADEECLCCVVWIIVRSVHKLLLESAKEKYLGQLMLNEQKQMIV